MIRPAYLCLLVFLFSTSPIFSQQTISVDTNSSIDKLILGEFLKGGIEIKKIKYSGSKGALGLFKSTSTVFPLKSGIILSTGKAPLIAGPNFSLSTSSINYTPGDSILDFIARGKTKDACIIEFDFIPSSENIAFDFIFASEEYPEYVNSMFNDVFAFIVTNPSTKESFNIAFLPKTKEPITVNNVNYLKNTEYFIDNPAPNILYLMESEESDMGVKSKKDRKKQDAINKYNLASIKCKTQLCEDIQYDGFTKVITAKAKVVPDQMYHFKIGIADVHDAIYDSGVILQSHSFKSYDRFGIIKGDTSGEIVKDEDLIKEQKLQQKIEVKKEIKTEPSIENINEKLLFDFDKYNLTDEDNKLLKEIAAKVQKGKVKNLKIIGHTDSYGSDQYNEYLSYQRADAVQKKLVELGVNKEQLTVEFYGEKQAASDNSNKEGRSLNRRVEITSY
jgi:outer membrane protein OmpA-like peptidoglycan-associated protein